MFKNISYRLFSFAHGKIKGAIKNNGDERIKIKNVNTEKDLVYKVYKIAEGKLYTDRIHDTAVILDNKIVEGPSFQLRHQLEPEPKIYNSNINDNIIFKIGTPRRLRNLDGKVLSLLTGGAGNENYWHWIYDVLPRIELCKKSFGIEEVDYFLFPSLLKNFQNETLDLLNIPKDKRLSSEKYRHIKSKELIVTDHPVEVSGNSTLDIQNIPDWIINWLKNKFIDKKTFKNKNKNKIYIERDFKFSKKIPERSISNEVEVKKYLLNNGFTSVRLGEINFKKQVELFSNADFIIGLHGAAFANIVFCNPGTKIIELKSSTAGPVIKNLAKKNNLDYNSISSEAEHLYKYSFPTQQGHIHIPISSLNEILKKQ